MEKEFDKQIQKRLKKIEKQEKIQPSNPEKKVEHAWFFKKIIIILILSNKILFSIFFQTNPHNS
jgi:hypothetical protein